MYAITIADLRRHDACDLRWRIVDLEAHLGRAASEDEPILLTTWAKVTPSTGDLIWALRVRPEGIPIAQEFALRTAERALPLVGTAREVCEAAISAARGFLAGTVSREALRDATHLTYPAYAAHAAYAARTAHTAHTAVYYAVRAVYYDPRAAYGAAFCAVDAAASYEGERALQRADLLEILATMEAPCPS